MRRIPRPTLSPLAPCIALVLLLMTSAATAAPAQRMRVLLDVEEREEPAYLCVVAQTIEESTRCTGPSCDVLTIEQATHIIEGSSSVDCAKGQLRCSDTYRVLTSTTATDASASLAALSRLDKSLSMRCERNALTRYDKGLNHILILQLDSSSETNIPKLTSLSLFGNLTSLQVGAATVGKTVKALAIVALDGDYQGSEPLFLNTEHEVSLRLAPVFRDYDVQLPDSHQKATGYTLRRCATGDLVAPLPDITAPIRLRVEDREQDALCLCPEVSLQDRTTLPPTKNSQSRVEQKCPAGVYRFDKGEARTIQTQISSFNFSWHRHCAYPLEVCPEAKLPGLYGSCEPTAAFREGGGMLEECRYHCSLSQPIDKLPLALEMSTPGDSIVEQTWTSRIDAVGQALSSYVDAEDRRLLVHLTSLCGDQGGLSCVDNVDQKLSFTELQLPHGRRLRIKPDQLNKAIPAPGLGCSDTIIYRHYGQQSWEESSVKVDHGRVVLPAHATEVGNLVSFAVQAGGGISFPRFQQQELASKPHATPFGKLEGILSWGLLRTHGHAWDLEGRFGAAIGQQWYETFRQDEGAVMPPGLDVERERVLHAKVLMQLGAIWRLPYNFYLGLSAGASNGRPLFVEDENLVPRAWNFVTTFRGGMVIARLLRVELELMVVFNEPTRSFEFTTLGAPTSDEASLTTLLTALSFRFDNTQ